MKSLTFFTLVLLLTTALALLPANAQVAPPVHIPDDNLAVAIREALGLPTDAVITADAMRNLTGLEAPGKEIADLTGLEHAVNLTALDLRDTGVSDVSPLSALTQLEVLHLGGTAVSDVSPLSALTQLTELGLRATAVSDVSPLANLTQLTSLSLSDTGVSDVSPLANLTQLTELLLTRTAVSDVSPLAALTQLTYLYLSGPGVSDVSPLAALTQLTELSLGGPGVSDVSPLAALTQLTYLHLGGPGVSDVSPLAALTQLEVLHLGGTAVSDVSPLLGLNLTGTSWSSIGLLLTASPLSYASLHTHIPALQAKGIEVEFDNVAHPALLKTSGDGQEGAPAATLKTAFVVEVMDEHGKPIVGIPVQFDILAGGGRLSAQTATTDAQGLARVTFTLGAASGINKVKATSEGIASWVLFTAVGTEEVPQLVADVNGDGEVDSKDLVEVAENYGLPVESDGGPTADANADVNGDGVVDVVDVIDVLALIVGIDAAAGAPAIETGSIGTGMSLLRPEDVRQWLRDAKAVNADPAGIAALERLLAALTRVEVPPPSETVLLANYPNPFNPETWIPYALSEATEVTVTIYAANGAVVSTLDLGHQRAGSYASRSRAAYWDGRNAAGESVASGVYFYTLQAGDFSATRKMLIMK